MNKQLARILGILVAGLAFAGLFMERGHFLKLMNVNAALDILRIALAALLLYAGFSKKATPAFTRSVVGAVGILYIGLAILGLINSTLWGTLPDGLTGFDILFHLIVGAIAARAAYRVPPQATSST